MLTIRRSQEAVITTRESHTASKTSGNTSLEASSRGHAGPSAALAFAMIEVNPSTSEGLPAGTDGGYPAGISPRRGGFSTCMHTELAPA